MIDIIKYMIDIIKYMILVSQGNVYRTYTSEAKPGKSLK